MSIKAIIQKLFRCDRDNVFDHNNVAIRHEPNHIIVATTSQIVDTQPHIDFCSVLIILTVSVCIAVVVIAKQQRSNLHAIPTLSLLWFVDFVYTWLSLYKQNEAKRLYKTEFVPMPLECNINAMNWRTYIVYLIKYSRMERCRDYFTLRHVSSIWHISPSVVLTKQFDTLLIGPCETIGNAFINMLTTVFRYTDISMWLPLVIIMPVILVLLFSGLCAIISFLFDRPISVRIGTWANISFGTKLTTHVVNLNNVDSVVDEMVLKTNDDETNTYTTRKVNEDDYHQDDDDNNCSCATMANEKSITETSTITGESVVSMDAVVVA